MHTRKVERRTMFESSQSLRNSQTAILYSCFVEFVTNCQLMENKRLERPTSRVFIAKKKTNVIRVSLVVNTFYRIFVSMAILTMSSVLLFCCAELKEKFVELKIRLL